MARSDVTDRINLLDGSVIKVRVLDGYLIDDFLVHAMKAEGYKLVTGKDIAPVVSRTLKDYLIKIGVIT